MVVSHFVNFGCYTKLARAPGKSSLFETSNSSLLTNTLLVKWLMPCFIRLQILLTQLLLPPSLRCTPSLVLRRSLTHVCRDLVWMMCVNDLPLRSTALPYRFRSTGPDLMIRAYYKLQAWGAAFGQALGSRLNPRSLDAAESRLRYRTDSLMSKAKFG